MRPETLFHNQPLQRSPGLTLMLVATGLAGFLGSVLLFRTLVVPRIEQQPEINVLTDKLHHFGQVADQIDLLFVGSSNVYRSVDPVQIDQELARQGATIQSFNFAVPNLNPLEAQRIIDHITELRPKRLRWVVIEPSLVPFALDNWATNRARYFLDWPGLRFSFNYLLAEKPASISGQLKSLVLSMGAVASFGSRMVSPGRVSPLVFPEMDKYRPRNFARLSQQSRGFKALDDNPSPELKQRRQRFQDRRTYFEQALRAPRIKNWQKLPLGSTHQRFLENLVDQLGSIDTRVFFLIPPGFLYNRLVAGVLEEHEQSFQSVPLLNYTKGFPDSYGQIYDFDLWFDHGHLNGRGATLFSVRLAQDLSPLLSTGAPHSQEPH